MTAIKCGNCGNHFNHNIAFETHLLRCTPRRSLITPWDAEIVFKALQAANDELVSVYALANQNDEAYCQKLTDIINGVQNALLILTPLRENP